MIDIHEQAEIARFKDLKGFVFLDIGANVGRWTLGLADNFEEIWAFEPNVHAYRVLFDNINNLNIETGIHHNIHAVMTALSSFTGKTTLQCYESTTWSTILPRNPGITDRPPVEMQTVGTFMLDEIGELRGKNIDLIKIDTEGAELEVIQGALVTILKNHPSLHIEYHTAADCQAILETLDHFTFERVRLDKDRGFLIYRRQ